MRIQWEVGDGHANLMWQRANSPGELWQGADPPVGPFLNRLGFTNLVLCAEELQHRASLYPGVHVDYLPLDDADYIPPNVMPMGQRVARMVHAGRRVLVACHMGINRSGLLVAVALWHLTGAPGPMIITGDAPAPADPSIDGTLERDLRGLRGPAPAAPALASALARWRQWRENPRPRHAAAPARE
jgi:hypothetical protein